MAADGGGGRELLALIHQHLLRGGFARAARELQAQSGQKLLPSLSTSLEDIFTHWEKTPPNSKRKNVSDEEAAIPEKIRVPDPVSSSESSEKEEDEKEKAKAANAAASLSLATNLVVNVESSEEDESSSEEEALAGKGAVTVTAAVVGGKAANSLHSPPKPSAPAGRTGGLSAAGKTVLSNKQQPNAPAAAPSPAKAQKLPSPAKPGHATAAVAKKGQSKAPVTTKAPESSSSSSSSSSSESEEEEETPAAKAAAPKAELAAEVESSSEESSDDTSSEEELATSAIQAKPAVKAVQSNAAPVKSAPAAPVSLKNAVKQTAVAASQAKPASVTVPGAAQPDDTSESSGSSDSEDEECPLVTQTKPPPKSSQAVPSPVKPTPAASLSVKAAPAKTLPLSQGKTAPKPTVPKQAKTSLGRTAAPTKPAESIMPVESTASSASEEEDLPVPISQKRLSDQPKPIPNLTQAAKAGQPEKAVVSTLKSQVSESGSSDSSDSEEESPAAQKQPPQAVKANSVPQPANVKKTPASAPATAPPAVDSSDDSSEESDSEDEIVPPSQTLSQQNVKVTAVSSMVSAKANATLPSGKKTKTPAAPAVSRVSESLSSDTSEHNVLAGKVVVEETKVPAASSQKQRVPVGKSPPATTAAPGNSTAKARKPVLQPGQDTHPSQAVPPTHAEDTSDSSSSSDSDVEEAPKQPAKLGSLQKPGGTQPAQNSSLESSEEEEEDAASQSLLTGYPVLSKTPVTPQAPKTVPPQPGGEVGPGKAAGSAANSLAKGSLKAALADSLSSDSSDSDTDDNQVAANHKAENNPPSGQEATEASNKEKVAGKTEPGHASLKTSSLKKTLATKENNVGAAGVQVTPASSHALLSVPQSQQPSSGSQTEVTTAASIPAVQTVEGLEVKKKKKKEKKEKKEKEKKKPSSTADKAVKTPKSKDKEKKKQKTSQKRKLTGEDGAVGQPKEKKLKGQANEEEPKKKKKKADGDLEKVAGSKEKKKAAKKKKPEKEKKKTEKEKKKSKKVSLEEAPVADGSAEVHKKKKKKKKGAEPEGL